MIVDPILRVQLHLDADVGIACRPVSGHRVSIVSIGRFVDLFATPEDLARLATAITGYLHEARPLQEFTVEIDAAEAERFRLETERDLRGEDE